MVSEAAKVYVKTFFKLTGIVCFVLWWDKTSPLGWISTRLRPKEEREMLKRTYQRRIMPYPDDEEAVKEYLLQGPMGTKMGPDGFVDQQGRTIQKIEEDKKVEKEIQKMWLKMRNEAIQDLEQQGYEAEVVSE